MTTDSKKTQLEVGVDPTPAKEGLGEIAASAQRMAQTLESAGKQAGAGIESIGDKADAGAKKAERAYKSLESEIRRLTASAQAQAEGTGRTGEILNRALAQGLDPARLEPGLAKLRQFEAQMKGTGVSAAQMSAALRGVPAQFTDIAVSLASGQQPLTVFLQQGGQLKDMFGGAGAAAKALGGYVLGLVNPFSVAAAAAVGLAVAYNQGSKEADAYRLAIVTTGNVAGVTADQLANMAANVSKATGATKGAAAEVLAQLAGQGDIASASFERVTASALRFSQATGTSIETVVKQFAELGKDPLTASVKLNESTNFLTESVYRQVRSLEEQGKYIDASRVAMDAYADTIDRRSSVMVQNLGYLESAWEGIKKGAKAGWDAMLNLGRPGDPIEEARKALDVAQQAAQSIYASDRDRKRLQAAQAQLAAIEGRVAGKEADAQAQKEQNEAVQASLRLGEQALKQGSELEKQRRELMKVTADYTKAISQAGLDDAGKAKIEKDYLAVVSGLTKVKEAAAKVSKDPIIKADPYAAQVMQSYAKGLEGFAKITHDATAASEGLSKSQASLLAIQSAPEWASYSRQQQEQIIYAASQAQAAEDLAQAQKLARQAVADTAKEIAAAEEAQRQQVASAEMAAIAAEQELANYGLLKSEIQKLTLVRLEDARENAALAGEDVSNIEKRISAQKRLIAATQGTERKEAETESAKRAAEEWKRTADQINQSLTDALLRGFESGKGFAENLRDTVANMFKTLVLRPIIKEIVSPAAGAITSVLGGNSYAPGQPGSAGNVVGAAPGLFNSFATSSVGNSLGLSYYNGTAMELTGAGSAIGGALPWIGAGLGLVSLIKSLDDSGTMHTGGLGAYSASTGAVVGDAVKSQSPGFFNLASADYQASTEQASVKIAQSIVGMLDATAKTFGQQAGYFAATAFADDTSKDGAWGSLLVKLGDKVLADWGPGGPNVLGREFANGEAGAKEYANAVAADVTKILKGMDLPAWAERFTDALPATADLDALTQTVAKIAAYPNELLAMAGTSRDALVKTFTDGLVTGDAAAAGQSVADTLVASVEAAMYTNASGQIFDIVNQGLVTPIIDAMVTGQSLTEALSQASIDAVVAKATAAAQTLNAVMSDPAFTSALESLKTNVGSALGQAGSGLTYKPQYQVTTPAVAATVADVAANGASTYTYTADTSAADAAAQALKSQLDTRKTLELDLARAMGDTARVQALLTEGMDAQTLAAYKFNEAIQQQIDAQNAINSARTSNQAAYRELVALRDGEAAAAALDLAEATKAMTADQKVSYLVQSSISQAIKAAITAEQQRQDLLKELAGITDTNAQALTRQREALDESNRALFDQVQAAKAAKEIAAERAGLETAWLRATGQSAILRERELAAMAPANRAIQQLIWGYEDSRTASDAALAAVEKSIDAERELANTALNAREETVTAMRSVFELLRDEARSLYGEVSSTSAMMAAQARQIIGQALSGGAMPTRDELSGAISAVKNDIGKTQFATQFEADRARLVLAGQLSTLRDVSKDQLSEAEQAVQIAKDQLKSLDDQLQAAKDQLDTLRGIKTGVDALPEALAAFAQALAIERAGGQAVSSQSGQRYTAAQISDAVGFVQQSVSSGSLMDIYRGVQQNGLTSADTAALLNLSGYQVSQQDVLDWARLNGLPAFAQGINYVPEDMPALIHKGERVMPAADNAALMAALARPASTSGDTQRLEGLVSALTTEVRRLQGLVAQGNEHTGQLAAQFDSVSAGGDRLLMETA